MARPKGEPRSKKFDSDAQERYLELIRQGGRRCASMEALGMSYQNLYAHIDQHPEFVAEIQKAECAASESVANMLLESCKKGNTQAQIYWLQNRSIYRGEAEWQDRRKQDIKVTAAMDNISPDEEKLLSQQRGLITQEEEPTTDDKPIQQ